MDVLLELCEGGLGTRLVLQQRLFLDVGIHGDEDGDPEGVVLLREGEEDGDICLPWNIGVANTQDVRVQEVTTIRLDGVRRLPSLWRSITTFPSPTPPITVTTTLSSFTFGYTR